MRNRLKQLARRLLLAPALAAAAVFVADDLFAFLSVEQQARFEREGRPAASATAGENARRFASPTRRRLWE